MIRNPVVAGQFYPGDPAQLREMVDAYLGKAATRETEPTIVAMAPHAGYIYSGPVAGQTLGEAKLAKTIILLGPNHTGLGRPLSVWDTGGWETPLGVMSVEADLAASLIGRNAGFESDQTAHAREHSLEVMLPFLQAIDSSARIVPIAIAAHDMGTIERAGQALAEAVTNYPQDVSIVVSSDMSHYVSHEDAKSRDAHALKAIEELDPNGLYETVRAKNISMCGVLPMTLGLVAANALGAKNARITAYATSGDASGDYSKVVGYAGAIVS
jgi:hypothetical protein